jgi:hypothetical protein
MKNTQLTAVGKGYCVETFNPIEKVWNRQCPADFDFATELAAMEHGKRQIEMPLALKGKISFRAKVFRVIKSDRF